MYKVYKLDTFLMEKAWFVAMGDGRPGRSLWCRDTAACCGSL
jgi:hypothetical protein